MQRFKQPNMDLHPDGEWIRYDDHVEAMKRIAGDGGQAEPVAWRHSHTLCLYETREDVPLADGDEWAVPLYLAAPAPTQGTQGEPCAGIAGELPEPTVGKLTAYIRSLQDKSQQRFYIDHGVIHDAITGKHVHGDRDVEPGVADEAVAMLNDLHARAVLAASPADQVRCNCRGQVDCDGSCAPYIGRQSDASTTTTAEGEHE